MAVRFKDKHRGEIVGLINEVGQVVYGYLYDEDDEYFVIDKPTLLKIKENETIVDSASVSGAAVEFVAELLVNVAQAIVQNDATLARTTKESWIQAYRSQVMQYIRQALTPIPVNYAPIVSGKENDGMAGVNLAYFPKAKYILVLHEAQLSAVDNEQNKRAIEELRNIIEDTYNPKKVEEYMKLFEQLQAQDAETQEKLKQALEQAQNLVQNKGEGGKDN